MKIEIGVPFHEANQNHVIQNSLWGIGSPCMHGKLLDTRFASKAIHTPSVILVKPESSRGSPPCVPLRNAELTAEPARRRRASFLPRSRRPLLAGTPSPFACLNRRRRAPWSAPTCAICPSHLCRTGRLFEPTCSTAGPRTLGAAVRQTLSSPRANGRYALRKGGRVIAPQPGPALPSQQEPADWLSLGIAPDSQ